MSREDVIRQIVERENRNQELTEEVVRREDVVLYALACDCFGIWDTALRYAGVSMRRVHRQHKSNAEAVTHQIRQLCHHARALEGKHIHRRKPALYKAALKHFESWEQALRAAGVVPENIIRYRKDRQPSKSQILATLRRRHQQGQSLRRIDVICENYAFFMAVRTMFGSWMRALVAAGLLENGVSLKKAKWNEQRILAEIRRLYAQTDARSLSCKRHPALADAARRRFGAWSTALRAAGVPVRKPYGKTPRWSHSKILEAIVARANQNLPLRGVKRLDSKLHDAAVRYFGSWSIALAVAGVSATPIAPEEKPQKSAPPPPDNRASTDGP